MMDNLKMEKNKAKGNIHLKVDKYMKVSFIKIICMGKEF